MIRMALTTLVLVLMPFAVWAAPSAELWEKWVPDPVATATAPDHRDWDAFLKRFVVAAADGVNRVDYASVDNPSRQLLDGYIDGLSQLTPTAMSKPEAMAYWVNLYNALTVQVILDHYPVRSIRDIDISPGLFSDGPWGATLIEIEGELLSLDDIEHRILRPIWMDPRIHYAVNCASIGCPNLQAEAFEAESLESQLDAAARAFVNHARAIRFGEDGLEVSSIYHWFRSDFGSSDADVISHLHRYADAQLAARLRFHDRIADHRYDWHINSVM